MYSLRKSKKGFTLIELMVVVAIIGVLALLGLRLYTGQQEKAKNAIIKANVGTIQTLIQADLADMTDAEVSALWVADGLTKTSGIHNPVGGTAQTTAPTSSTAKAGEVWVTVPATPDTAGSKFIINGRDAADTANVYKTANELTARK